ncbi:hypothetical protein PGT21_033233 [Puccinia graminis f. sp. tritici]|uniref:Inositol polyphosphate-related phosphatase domain-containing protein n=2 Tax=Puccinia graminis f. sp. tritici TaxID=56615 RepID=E3JQG9_PUCGT|nr:uncharacterized protein PGTG_00342 [Puccinia graminis f. sp. tritici CRL 75-36-700-3]EFP74386.1 hypothetical protein PGTG_00342 [Puccinia graminis f. sp. tritici CRL 75-36-700-3]KAA1115192.1 hypothetical protein PGT21_033233 [Puccinia graminis f. sp. tritici]
MANPLDDRPLRIRCMTYNLNRGRAEQKLSRLVFDEQVEDESQLPDFYAIGFQELAGLHLTFPSLTGGAILDRRHAMIRAFSSGLRTIKGDQRKNEKTDFEALTYNLLADPSHGGLGLLVYARNDTVFKDIQSVRTSEASCGFLNLMNNKGAVGVRVTIRRSDVPDGKAQAAEEVLTFVNAHLAAHDSGIIARNRDYQSIINRLLFETSHGHHTIYDTSHLFFMGDLNYRISLTPSATSSLQPITKESLTKTIQEGRHSSLFPEHDTLSHQHAAGKVLVGLREAPINFKPTYKYKLNSGDQFVSFDHRLPGWTDRIFLASWLDDSQSSSVDQPGGAKVLAYQSLPEYDGSDHKPVFAVIDLPRYTQSQSNPHFLNTRPHIEIDTLWKEKKLVGMLLDKTCGLFLLAAVLVGFGNIPFGFINLGLISLFGWKWTHG